MNFSGKLLAIYAARQRSPIADKFPPVTAVWGFVAIGFS